MKRAYVSLLLSLAVLGAGCAQIQPKVSGETDLNSTAVKQTGQDIFPQINKEAYFAQDENVKKAVAILINVTEKLENQLILVSGNVQRLTKQLGEAVQDVESNKKLIAAQSVKITEIEKNVSQQQLKINEIFKAEQNKTKNIAEANTSSVVKIGEGKVVQVKVRHAKILKEPNQSSAKIKTVYAGDRFFFDGLQNGYYHLTEQNGWIEAKHVKEKDSKKQFQSKKNKKNKTTIIKTSEPQETKNTQKADAGKNNIQEHKAAIANEGEFFSEKSSGQGAKIDDNVGVAVAENLLQNKNTTSANIKEQCTVGLLQKGVQPSTNKSALEACIGTWNNKSKIK